MPSEYISVLTEEIDELAFLFVVKVVTNGDFLGWVVRVEPRLLCVLAGAEGVFRLQSCLFSCRHFTWFHLLGELLELFFGNGGLCTEGVAELAFLCQLEISRDGYDTAFGAWQLEFVVDIAWPSIA